jgi:hypothetical protein
MLRVVPQDERGVLGLVGSTVLILSLVLKVAQQLLILTC